MGFLRQSRALGVCGVVLAAGVMLGGCASSSNSSQARSPALDAQGHSVQAMQGGSMVAGDWLGGVVFKDQLRGKSDAGVATVPTE